jgi:predicted kinase
MTEKDPKLFLFCGKIASGKSTLAESLAIKNNALLISQDEWLSTLYPDEIININDYARYFGRLRQVLGGHLIEILLRKNSVVLDFPANTFSVRKWMLEIINNSGCANELHFLDTPDLICKGRLRKRNELGAHKYKTTDEEFDLFTSYFNPPSLTEGFVVINHKVEI